MRNTNLLGRRYGLLIVLAASSIDAKNKRQWSLRCDCGAITSARTGDLTQGKVVSCGCAKVAKARAAGRANVTHGAARNDKRTPTYQAWLGMRQRCLNKRGKDWPQYGGRGIAIAPRWSTFENFLADMGEKPAGMSLDRFPNNDGNYEPSNCRWANAKQQSNNRRAPRGRGTNTEAKRI